MKSFRVLAFSLSVLAACGGTKPASEAGTTPAASSSAAAAPTPSASNAATNPPSPVDTAPQLPQAGPPVVTVVDPGAEPRKALRYAFKKTTETMIMDMKMDLTLALGAAGKSPKVSMPTVRTSFTITPTDVDADGTLTSNVEMKKVDVLDDRPIQPEMKKKLNAEMQKIVGLKGKTVVTSRGVTKEATIEMPPGADASVAQLVDSIKDSLRNMSSPFPEEPVGKGAKWDVKTVVAGAITIEQTASYQLKEMNDKGVTNAVTVSQKAPPQAMKPNDKLPPGATMALRSHTGTGTGTQKVTFDKITPVSTLKLDSKSEMSVTQGGSTSPIGLEMTIDLTVKPAK